ncbi:MAG: hypothetical protein A3E78_11005 [Alphaproteobacteria bacterium RIFCSPHIGHO2_12_FULL_63_12]|nr:MAG: hypothetical protein A3E78_11005 [Alphaproteobacteria bacterium RIFCSPHIGHO2_12_FULL_63_12]
MIVTVALMRHGGSHLIRPIVSNMGVERILEPGKFECPIDQAEGPVIVFIRDPRDRMAATLRWWMAREKGRRYGTEPDDRLAGMLVDEGFLEHMLQWSRIWCVWPGALTVRFEDMRSDGPREVGRIANHLGIPVEDPVAAFEAVYGKGRTYTGKHSNWKDYFGPKSLAAWDAHGGPELLGIMGYA